MSSQVSSPLLTSQPQPHFEIEQDSILFKGLACLPILGAIPALLQQLALNEKIQDCCSRVALGQKEPRVIELIEVKNDYKKAGVINSVLSIAIAIALLCSGIITGVIFLITFGLVYAAHNIYQIYQNKDLINQLEANGMPFAIKIY